MEIGAPGTIKQKLCFLFLMLGVVCLGFEPNQCQATVLHSPDGTGQNHEKKTATKITNPM